MLIKHLWEIHGKFGNVAIIMDGAVPHRSKMLKAFVYDNDWLKILYLPRGSPYLKPCGGMLTSGETGLHHCRLPFKHKTQK